MQGAHKKTFGLIFFCFKSTVKSDLTHVERADPGRKAYEIMLIPAYHTMLLETEKSEIISWERGEGGGVCLTDFIPLLVFVQNAPFFTPKNKKYSPQIFLFMMFNISIFIFCF